MHMTQKRTKQIIGIGITAVVLYIGLRHPDAVRAGLSRFFGLFLPLILGLAFAMILNVPMSLLERKLFRKTHRAFLHKLRRPTAITLSVLLVGALLALIMGLIIPELIRAIRILSESLIDLIGRIRNMSEQELSSLPFGKIIVGIDWDATLSALQNWLKDKGGAIVNTAVGTIGSLIGGVVNFSFGLVFAVYILANKEKLKRQFTRLLLAWLPQTVCCHLFRVSAVVRVNFRNFVAGQSLEALILGSLCMLGMVLLRIPYALMVGTLVGIGALIPVIGAFAAAIVGAFIIFTESPIGSLIFLIFLIILQQIDGNLIYPRVMGNRVNLSPMWILAAVTVGGSLAGPIGMLLGVPVASTLSVLLKEATEQREKKKKGC